MDLTEETSDEEDENDKDHELVSPMTNPELRPTRTLTQSTPSILKGNSVVPFERYETVVRIRSNVPINLGPAKKGTYKNIPRILLRNSGLPNTIVLLIHSKDLQRSSNHREVSAAQSRNGVPGMCWMSQFHPIDGHPLDTMPEHDECGMCKARKSRGEDSACFYFTCKKNIKMFQ